MQQFSCKFALLASLAALVLAVAGCGVKDTYQSQSASNATPAASADSAAPAESAEPEPSAQPAAAAGDEITIQVVDVAGYQKVLDSHKGKVIFVDFWATWCTPCVEAFPHTVHVSRAFPKDQVAVISVSLDDPEEKESALAFLQKQEARFDNLLSEYGAGVESMEQFEIDNGVPHYKLYDQQGQLVKTLTPGPDLEITVERLDSEIRKVLEQE